MVILPIKNIPILNQLFSQLFFIRYQCNKSIFCSVNVGAMHKDDDFIVGLSAISILL